MAQIPGVGETTAKIISEALSGEIPTYLLELERRGGPALSERASALRAAIQGDCHSHSDWSDGGSPAKVMAEAAASLGYSYLALTDHSPRLTVANGLDAERLRRQLELVDQLNAELTPFRILTGIEVDILEDAALDQDADLLGRLDVVVASVHSKLRMESPEMTRRMVRAIENPHTDILGTAPAGSSSDGVASPRPSIRRRFSRHAARRERRSRSTPAPRGVTLPLSCSASRSARAAT